MASIAQRVRRALGGPRLMARSTTGQPLPKREPPKPAPKVSKKARIRQAFTTARSIAAKVLEADRPTVRGFLKPPALKTRTIEMRPSTRVAQQKEWARQRQRGAAEEARLKQKAERLGKETERKATREKATWERGERATQQGVKRVDRAKARAAREADRDVKSKEAKKQKVRRELERQARKGRPKATAGAAPTPQLGFAFDQKPKGPAKPRKPGAPKAQPGRGVRLKRFAKGPRGPGMVGKRGGKYRIGKGGQKVYGA